MTKRPTVESLNLAELLSSDNTYMVPAYQRQYAWKNEQISNLTEDLGSFAFSDSSYYILGQIIIAPNQSSNSQTYKFAVVDGQQRLTSIYLLFIALEQQFQAFGLPAGVLTAEGKALTEIRAVLHRTNLANGNEIPRFRATALADRPILSLLEGEALSPIQSSDSAENVKNNFEALSEWVRENLNTKELLTDFTNKVLYSVFLVTATLDDEAQALDIFEKLNSRGIPLSAAALLKALIFERALPGDYEEIDKRWESAALSIFKCRPQSISSLEYLMQALLQPETGKYVKSQDVHKEWKKLLEAKENPLFPNIQDFAAHIDNSAKNLALLASQTPNILNSRLIGTRHLGVVQHLPVALEASRFAQTHPDLYSDMCDLIDARLTLSLFAKEQANKLYPVMWKWSHTIRELGTNSSREKFIEVAGVKDSIDGLFKDAKNHFGDLSYTATSKRKKIRFALASIANYVESLARNVSDVTSIEQLLVSESRLKAKYDIDHVFPQSLSKSPEFDASRGFDWVNQIGNLCLFHSSDNRSDGAITPIQKSRNYAGSNLLLTRMLARPADVEDMLAGQQRFANVANRMRDMNAQNVLNWGPEAVELQTDYYFDLFEESLRMKMGI